MNPFGIQIQHWLAQGLIVEGIGVAVELLVVYVVIRWLADRRAHALRITSYPRFFTSVCRLVHLVSMECFFARLMVQAAEIREQNAELEVLLRELRGEPSRSAKTSNSDSQASDQVANFKHFIESHRTRSTS